MQLPMIVVADNVAVHAEPDAGSPTIRTLAKDDTIVALEVDLKTGSWVRFDANGVDGWCHLSLLLPVAEANVPWLVVAHREIGVDTTTPAGRKRIVEYMADAKKLSASEKNDPRTDWCACFMDWCMKQTGQQRERSPRALDWRRWGKKRPTGNDLPGAANLGDVAIGERKAKGAGTGHIAIYLDYDEPTDRILLLGGNQDDTPTFKGGIKAVRYTWYPRVSAQPYGRLLSLHYQPGI